MKAAPDKSHFSLPFVIFLGHIIEGSTITSLKSQTDAIIKTTPQSNKKVQEFLGKKFFLSTYVYKRQLNLRSFYKIFRQQNNFEWTLELQKRFDEKNPSHRTDLRHNFRSRSNSLCHV